ncbi:hypothetical protein [Enterococcus sp. AZ126]|uniref:hypothetical protein n=1 Tax=Enterococcus sp. AZ126 TaxID=2774635 RepID=UPI003F226FFC
MYADRKLVEQLLFNTKMTNTKIAEVAGIKSETTIRKFRSGESNLDNMRLGNAEALTSFAKETFYPNSDMDKKLEWMLKEFDEAGNEISYTELLEKMVDNYYELMKGKFVQAEKQ